MVNFIGHIEAKLDSKNRFVLPSALRKQLAATMQDSFVVKKDIYEPCLILYPKDVWQQTVEQLQQKLNPYNRQHNMFLRKFFADTAEITMDTNGRLLLPKRLTDQVQIQSQILIIGVGQKLEIWNPELFEASMISDEQFVELAQTLLGQNQQFTAE